MLRLVFTRAAEVREKQGPRVLALIVLPETDARAADGPRRRLLDRIASVLAVDLGVEIGVVQPRELLAKHDVST